MQKFVRAFHLDAGRKYFRPENIKTMLDAMAENHYNTFVLYFSDNQGFRFGLDDMTVRNEFGTYDLKNALGDGYEEGEKHPDGSGKYLTQTEMDDLIGYANERNIEVIPCLDAPGHMGTILEQLPGLRFGESRSSIDLKNPEARAFAFSLIAKYAAYFKARGCRYFNFGADEFANDLGSMGFDVIYHNGLYQEYFVPFFNDMAKVIKGQGLIPMCFNDGVCYNNDTTVQMDTDVVVCYWSAGWNGYDLGSAKTLSDYGFSLINTNGEWYWILGTPDNCVDAEKAAKFQYRDFIGGSRIDAPMGAMLCAWCDRAQTHGPDGGNTCTPEICNIFRPFAESLPEKV